MRVPTTIVEFSTIHVPLPMSANQPSSSAPECINSPASLATTTLTIYSNISVPYVSTVLQPTTLLELSTIYIPSVLVSSIFVPQQTTVFHVSTTTVSQLSALIFPTPPLSNTALLPSAPTTVVQRSTQYIYATITLFITSKCSQSLSPTCRSASICKRSSRGAVIHIAVV